MAIIRQQLQSQTLPKSVQQRQHRGGWDGTTTTTKSPTTTTKQLGQLHGGKSKAQPKSRTKNSRMGVSGSQLSVPNDKPTQNHMCSVPKTTRWLHQLLWFVIICICGISPEQQTVVKRFGAFGDGGGVILGQLGLISGAIWI